MGDVKLKPKFAQCHDCGMMLSTDCYVYWGGTPGAQTKNRLRTLHKYKSAFLYTDVNVFGEDRMARGKHTSVCLPDYVFIS